MAFIVEHQVFILLLLQIGHLLYNVINWLINAGQNDNKQYTRAGIRRDVNSAGRRVVDDDELDQHQSRTNHSYSKRIDWFNILFCGNLERAKQSQTKRDK